MPDLWEVLRDAAGEAAGLLLKELVGALFPDREPPTAAIEGTQRVAQQFADEFGKKKDMTMTEAGILQQRWYGEMSRLGFQPKV